MNQEVQTVKIVLPRPHKYQKDVLESDARFRVLLWGRRGGKTWVCLMLAIQHMLQSEAVAYVTPTFSLSKDFMKEVLSYIPPSLIAVENKSDLYVELITGGSLRFFSSEAPQNFRGRKFSLCILDECAFYQNLEETWYSIIRPTLGDLQGKAVFISTPRGQGFFHSLYLKGKNKEDGFESWHMPTNLNPFFPPEEFEEARRTMPQARFNEEFLAIPGLNSSNPFGTDNINKNIIQELSKEPTIVYGIDLAKYNDYTVIVGLDANGKMSYFDRFQLPWALTMEKIKQLPANILKVVDSTGVGDVVFEALQLSCQNIRGFKFTTESKPKIIYELIKDVEQGKVMYNQMTADEMHVYEFKYSSTGHISFNAMAGYHDDIICALAIANHFKGQAVAASTWKLYLT